MTGEFNDTLAQLKEAAVLMGLTQVSQNLYSRSSVNHRFPQAEFAALNGAGYAIGDKYCTHKVTQAQEAANVFRLSLPHLPAQDLFCKRDVGDDEPITLDNRFFTT